MEDMTNKQMDNIPASISSSNDVTASLHSKINFSDSKPMTMVKNENVIRDASLSGVDSALEAQEMEECDDAMEDAVSDVTSTTNDASSTSDKENEEMSTIGMRKRVHFADDADSSSSRASMETSSQKENPSQRSNLRKRASSNVNPRPAYLSRKREAFIGEHLNITPSESLEFVVMDFQKETLDIINLKNTTEAAVTYKVKTTAPEKYRVRPSTGVIQAGASIDVNVYLPPGMHSTNRDKFLIMSLVVAEGVANDKNLNEINELWKNAAKEDIVEHRIRCVLIDQSQASFADETLAKDVTDLKESLERVEGDISHTQKLCEELKEIFKWNQIFLKLIVALLMFILVLCTLLFQGTRFSVQDHCLDKYSEEMQDSGHP